MSFWISVKDNSSNPNAGDLAKWTETRNASIELSILVSISFLINIWQMSWQSHNLNHDQTKHPIENFISQNLFKTH